MRTACVLVPTFAVAIERRERRELAGEAVVVYDGQRVIDASADAIGAGPGLTLRQAKALCPQAVFVQANHVLYRGVYEAMLDALECVATLVEPTALGVASADISGLQHHYTDEFELAGALAGAVQKATGLLPNVGIANGKFVAWVAASITGTGDAGVVLPGREREFLEDKDTSLLPLNEKTLRRLDLLALSTLGGLAALPRTAVEAQFGRAGKRVWELANGIDEELLRPRKREEALSERLSLDAPVVVTEVLLVAGRQLLTRLVRRLRGRTARRLHMQLLADERIVWEKVEAFREPAGDLDRMLLILKTRLSLLVLDQAVDAIVLTLTGVGEEVGKQAKLFTDSRQNLNQIADAIQQLRARYGRPVIWRIAEVDRCSRHPEERAVLVPFDG